MFLFLLLAFVVIWALCLVGWTQIVFGYHDQGDQAESRGAFALGTLSGWRYLRSRMLELVRASGYGSASPIDGKLACCASDGLWQASVQEVEARTLGNCGLTSWSKKSSNSVAPAAVARLEKHRVKNRLGQFGSRPRLYDVSSMLSLAP